MKVFMYTVYDSASGVYDRPFVCRSDNEAMRSFGDICLDAEHPFGKHPEHYSICRNGIYDDNTGKVEGTSVEVVMTGLQAVAESTVIKPGHLEAVRYADSDDDAHGFIDGKEIKEVR